MKANNEIKGLINPISLTVFVGLSILSVILYAVDVIPPSAAVAGLFFALFCGAVFRIADQWEKAVVLRMGKFIGLKGPGLFLIIPIIDRVAYYIDQRVRVTDFSAEETLTKDTVPTNVDAVVYWTVWDVEKAALEVQDYITAVSYIAQTGLRDIIGQHELADL
ncbi:MAG: SPFH domain-containing protein, partial [Candidatus Aminicenantes bacterium]|nr:SPFH domain-containing protein [Candidatus Aminicenantes bacterium]